MAEPEAIHAAIGTALSPRDLAGLRVVVTAGPTLEDIDPVRFIGNRSTGKMGFALAERAAARGADVTLVAGPVSLPTPHGVRRIDVRGAVAMRQVLWQAMGLDLQKTDALIMSAAVADHRPAEPSASKIKKGDERVSIDLIKNPDLLAEVGAARAGKRPVLVGFAVETERGEALLAYARRKLADKRVDLVVANEASDAFGREDNRATLVSAGEARELPTMGKASLADVVLDRVRELAHDGGAK
jgi:phosphopantothenoylcysteine decarboxylase/phosphopantothenate--cysteine ligase